MYQENSKTLLRTEYIHLAGSLLATRETQWTAGGTTKVLYQHTDALGSPVAVSNQAGQVDPVDRTYWEPYGAAIGKPGYDGPGYTGHVLDAATGLTYMQQRYYDPAIGRFLSVDPITANSGTGANFNRYWYANNNPYKFTDPDGRMVVAKDGAQEPRIETAINAQSETRYEFSEGQLKSTEQCNDISVSSASYSSAIDTAIASDTVINVGFSTTADAPVIDAKFGGGLTGDMDGGGLAVRISGNSTNDVGVDGSAVTDAPADILRHEFVGHVAPQLSGTLTGNARDLDNFSRQELGRTKLAPTPFDPIREPAK